VQKDPWDPWPCMSAAQLDKHVGDVNPLSGHGLHMSLMMIVLMAEGACRLAVVCCGIYDDVGLQNDVYTCACRVPASPCR
jgi:hypothetical protein